jgi:hypothetical protein
MQQQLISLNTDLKRLQDEGYLLEVYGGHLLVRHIPYVSPSKEVKYGVFVCVLNLISPQKLGPPPDHTMFFQGETPCLADGSVYTAIINNSRTQQLSSDIIVNHYFSCKPLSGRYTDYYEKVVTYAMILATQANIIDKSATPKINENNKQERI